MYGGTFNDNDTNVGLDWWYMRVGLYAEQENSFPNVFPWQGCPIHVSPRLVVSAASLDECIATSQFESGEVRP
jgi:hypothetical protein